MSLHSENVFKWLHVMWMFHFSKFILCFSGRNMMVLCVREKERSVWYWWFRSNFDSSIKSYRLNYKSINWRIQLYLTLTWHYDYLLNHRSSSCIFILCLSFTINGQIKELKGSHQYFSIKVKPIQDRMCQWCVFVYLLSLFLLIKMCVLISCKLPIYSTLCVYMCGTEGITVSSQQSVLPIINQSTWHTVVRGKHRKMGMNGCYYVFAVGARRYAP